MTSQQALKRGFEEKVEQEGCPTCGAAVKDARKHLDWHEKQQNQLNQSGPTAPVGRL